VYPRSVGPALWNLAWHLGEIASIADAVAAQSRAPGFQLLTKSSLRRLTLGGRLLASRHPSWGDFFSITMREVAV
jgi:hypothetical protein